MYNIGGNNKSFKLLYLGSKWKIQSLNGYFINGYIFHIEDYGEGKSTYNNGACVEGCPFNEFKVDYYGKLEEIIELHYHKAQYIVFLFKYY